MLETPDLNPSTLALVPSVLSSPRIGKPDCYSEDVASFYNELKVLDDHLEAFANQARRSALGSYTFCSKTLQAKQQLQRNLLCQNRSERICIEETNPAASTFGQQNTKLASQQQPESSTNTDLESSILSDVIIWQRVLQHLHNEGNKATLSHETIDTGKQQRNVDDRSMKWYPEELGSVSRGCYKSCGIQYNANEKKPTKKKLPWTESQVNRECYPWCQCHQPSGFSSRCNQMVRTFWAACSSRSASHQASDKDESSGRSLRMEQGQGKMVCDKDIQHQLSVASSQAKNVAPSVWMSRSYSANGLLQRALQQLGGNNQNISLSPKHHTIENRVFQWTGSLAKRSSTCPVPTREYNAKHVNHYSTQNSRETQDLCPEYSKRSEIYTQKSALPSRGKKLVKSASASSLRYLPSKYSIVASAVVRHKIPVQLQLRK
jgi:alkylhydroperoxidase/carboxymuconolactone decarboxylase family protein YurZ